MVTSPQELTAAKARAREVEESIDDPITAALAYELLTLMVQDQLAGGEGSFSWVPADVNDLRAYVAGDKVGLDVDYLPHPGWSGRGAQTIAVQRNESEMVPLNTQRTGSGVRTVPIDYSQPGEVVVSFRGPDTQGGKVANHAFTLGQTLVQTASEALVGAIDDQVDLSRGPGFLMDRLRYQIHTLSEEVLGTPSSLETGEASMLLALTTYERRNLQQYLILLHEMLSDIIQVKPIAELTDELHLLAELATAVKTVTQSIEKQ